MNRFPLSTAGARAGSAPRPSPRRRRLPRARYVVAVDTPRVRHAAHPPHPHNHPPHLSAEGNRESLDGRVGYVMCLRDLGRAGHDPQDQHA